MSKAWNFIASVSLGALLPLTAFAAMSDSEATQAVQGALAGGESANSVIQMLLDDGRSLTEATSLAVAAAAGSESQPAIAKAGICAAQDATQAGQVGSDLLAELTGDMVTTVNALVANYDTGGCDDDDDRIEPPSSYAPTATGNNGGTNPDFPGSPSS